MHCPDNMSGFEYVELVAAVSLLLAKDQTAFNTFLLAEFFNDVSRQLFILAAFNEKNERNLKKASEQIDITII